MAKKRLEAKDNSQLPPEPAVAKRASAFDILERGSSFVSATRECLKKSGANVPRITSSTSAGNHYVLPVPSLAFQYMLGVRGILSGTILDILGEDGAGKSTLIFTLLGYGMQHNCPGMYVETENKEMLQARVERCLHTNRDLARKMYHALYRTSAFTLLNAVEQIEAWVFQMRDTKSENPVPMHIPLMVALDTFSKLMTPTEAAGFAQYVVNLAAQEKKEKKDKAAGKKPKKDIGKEKDSEEEDGTAKELNQGSNFEHAKIAHKWTRRLASLISSHNVIFIIGRHQNDKIDMNARPGGGGSFIPAEVKEQHNRTSVGGRAFHQSAAFQVLITKLKTDTAVIGGVRRKVSQGIKFVMSKNSFGIPEQMEAKLTFRSKSDTDTHQDAAFEFDVMLPEILQSHGVLQISAGKNIKHWTCKELGLENADGSEFAQKIYDDPELLQSLGKRLGIAGYDGTMVVPNILPEFEEIKEPDGKQTE